MIVLNKSSKFSWSKRDGHRYFSKWETFYELHKTDMETLCEFVLLPVKQVETSGLKII